jgi:hypothetical protein
MKKSLTFLFILFCFALAYSDDGNLSEDHNRLQIQSRGVLPVIYSVDGSMNTIYRGSILTWDPATDTVISRIDASASTPPNMVGMAMRGSSGSSDRIEVSYDCFYYIGEDRTISGTPKVGAYVYLRTRGDYLLDNWYIEEGETAELTVGTSITFTNGSKNVTGVGTAFLSELNVGDDIYGGTDGATYKQTIASITDNTHLTLDTNYVGTGGADTSAVAIYVSALTTNSTETYNSTQYYNLLIGKIAEYSIAEGDTSANWVIHISRDMAMPSIISAASALFTDGTTTVKLNDGTTAITAVGASTLPSIDSTPATNIDTWDVTGTNMTTSAMIDGDFSALLSGNLIDIALDTADIAANSNIIYIADSRNHDDAAADSMAFINLVYSGNIPGTNASTPYTFYDASYTGDLGGSGANADLYGIRLDFGGYTHTNSDMYAIYIDLSSSVVAGTQYGIYSILDATSTGFSYLDAGTNNVTSDKSLYKTNCDIEGEWSVVGYELSMDFEGAGMGAANKSVGYLIDSNEAESSQSGSQFYGFEAKLTKLALSGRTDYHAFVANYDGTHSGDDASYGLWVNCDMTLDNASEVFYGAYFDAAGATNTSSSAFNAIQITTGFDAGIDNASPTRLTNTTINGAFNYGADAGGDDDYEIALAPAITANTTGCIVILRATTANNGACSLDVGPGSASIKNTDGADPANGDIASNVPAILVYDGSNWVLINPVTSTN